MPTGACRPASRADRVWTPEDHGHPPTPSEDQQAPPPAAERGTEARAARALWNVSCASCHGATGRGDGRQKPPGAQVPDLSSPALQSERTDDQLAEVIRAGRGMMPAFGDQLNQEGIRVLVAYVRRLGSAAQPSASPSKRADGTGPGSGAAGPGAPVPPGNSPGRPPSREGAASEGR